MGRRERNQRARAMKGDGMGEKRVRRMKEKEGLKSREARKDCEKENERLENSRPWLLSYLSRVRR